MPLRRLAIITLFLINSTESVASQILELNSGSSVEVLSVSPMSFTKGPPALALQYRTQQKIDDTASLRKEVDEIWEHFVTDVDQGKYASAIIRADEPYSGASHSFIFEKRNAIWRTLESDVTPTAKIEEKTIRELMNRLDWLLDHNNGNALGLYLDANWKLTVLNAPDSDGKPEVRDRISWISDVRAGLGKTRFLEHRREILSLSINPKTQTAQLESRETTKRVAGSHHITLIERTGDTIVLRNRVLLLLNSTSVVEKSEDTESP